MDSKRTICIVASDGKSLTNFRGPLIKYFVSQGNRVVCVSIETKEEMNEAISSLGAEYVQVAGSRVGIGLSDGFKMINDYRKLFKSLKPDMCFFYMSKPTAFGSIAALMSGTKHFNVLVNGLENAYYRTGVKDFIVRCVMSTTYKLSAHFADNFFFQNHDDMGYFEKHHLLTKNNATVVGGSGVDMEHFKKSDLPDEPVFLMVARLLWSKGIREFLEAVTKMKKECPQAKVLLVGGLDDNDEALTKAELDEYIKKADIEYCGYSDDVRQYLNRCSVFVLPSYHEGLPRSVIEAMSVGRPIITTDVPGCRETVVDGKNGYIVPVKDSEVLSRRMIELAQNAGLRQKMAQQSYEMCIEKFEVGKVNEEMYKKMLEGIGQ